MPLSVPLVDRCEPPCVVVSTSVNVPNKALTDWPALVISFSSIVAACVVRPVSTGASLTGSMVIAIVWVSARARVGFSVPSSTLPKSLIDTVSVSEPLKLALGV